MNTNTEQVKRNIEAKGCRGAWGNGVKDYAVTLLEEALENGHAELPAEENALEQLLLNGAPNWHEYSWGGCALIYDRDIAKALCSPSELKRTRNGERRPNAREQWLDTQERALRQAFWLIRDIMQWA